MPYPALPDRRMPWDNDGTVAYTGGKATGTTALVTGADRISLNGTSGVGAGGGALNNSCIWLFFPEQREVTGIFVYTTAGTPVGFEGSNDTTNGMDGTWETATLSGGFPTNPDAFAWRANVKPVSFTGPKRCIRLWCGNSGSGQTFTFMHVYGQKAAGQTPDDILYLNGNNAYAEFAIPADFGDVPLGTTRTWTFKVKNASATHTANSINIQCNDADFAISSDGSTWVTTINIASLAAGASSSVLYIRNTTPAVGSPLGPRYARLVTTVASYT